MNINTLLQQQRRSPPLPIKWLLLALLMLILMYTWQQRFFSAWVLIPFIFSVALLNKCLIVSKQHKRLKLIDELTLDPQFWQTFQREHPYIHISQRRLIEQGFKDYLALHVLVPQPYAMPSHAVDALWHVMLQYPDRYKKMSKSILGKRLSHNPYIGVQDHNVQKRQLMAAWKYSCLLVGSDPAYPQQLPRLFGIDQAMSWQNGQVYDLNTLQQEYRLFIKAQSSSDSSSGSSSCGSSCSSCGGGGD